MPEFIVHYTMRIDGDVIVNAKSKGSARNAILTSLNKIKVIDMAPFNSSREASSHSKVSIPLSEVTEV